METLWLWLIQVHLEMAVKRRDSLFFWRLLKVGLDLPITNLCGLSDPLPSQQCQSTRGCQLNKKNHPHPFSTSHCATFLHVFLQACLLVLKEVTCVLLKQKNLTEEVHVTVRICSVIYGITGIQRCLQSGPNKTDCTVEICCQTLGWELCHILTDFKSFFTTEQRTKFPTKLIKCFPPDLNMNITEALRINSHRAAMDKWTVTWWITAT